LQTLPITEADLLTWHRGAVELARKALLAQTATLQEAHRTKACAELEELLQGQGFSKSVCRQSR